MVLHAGIGHGLRVRDIRIVPIDEDARLRDIHWQVVSRPEGAVLVRPGFEGMIGAAARIQAMDKDETLPCQYSQTCVIPGDILDLGCFGGSIDLLQEGELIVRGILLVQPNPSIMKGGRVLP